MKHEVSDNTRLLALEECEQKIVLACRRGLDATCTIAKELTKILDLELWREPGCDSYDDYVAKRLPFDIKTAYRIQSVARTIKLLDDAGLPRPANDSQVYELARLEEDKQADLWRKVTDWAQEKEVAVTAQVIRGAVDATIKAPRPAPASPPATTASAGVTTSLEASEEQEPTKDGNGQTNTALEAPKRIKLSDKGEAALERIRRHCGDSLADGIAELLIPISERDLIKWADQEDPVMTAMARFIGQHWTVHRALGFVSQTNVVGTTQVTQLVALAQADPKHVINMRLVINDIPVAITVQVFSP